MFLGFPADNHAAVSFLAGQGFECIEDDYNNTSLLDHLERFPENESIVRIQKDNYKLFEMLHSQTDDDMYWNCKRIYDDLDNWVVQAALSDAKHRKGNVMTFFCDEEYEKVAKECGLECIGNYLCYKTHLN